MKIKNMRKTMALLLSASLVSGMCISSAAADNIVSSGTQETTSEQESMTQNTSGDTGAHRPDGQPPEMPNGEKPDGQPPELPNGEKPDGQIPGGPGQMGEGEPGGQGMIEGQLGSWFMGETDASGIEGDDYAYGSALYITSEGIEEEKSSTSGGYSLSCRNPVSF